MAIQLAIVMSFLPSLLAVPAQGRKGLIRREAKNGNIGPHSLMDVTSSAGTDKAYQVQMQMSPKGRGYLTKGEGGSRGEDLQLAKMTKDGESFEGTEQMKISEDMQLMHNGSNTDAPVNYFSAGDQNLHQLVQEEVKAVQMTWRGGHLMSRAPSSEQAGEAAKITEVSHAASGDWTKVSSNGWCSDDEYLDDMSEGDLTSCESLCAANPACKYASYQARGNGWCIIFKDCDLSNMVGTHEADGPKYDTYSVKVVIGSLNEDLRRAMMKRPREKFLGQSQPEIDKVLNGHLMRTELSTRPCEDWSTEQLQEFMTIIGEHLSDELQHIYQSNLDRRAMQVKSPDERKLQWKKFSTIIRSHPQLFAPLQEAHCREAVMWWSHHLTGQARDALRSTGITVPLLPATHASSDDGVASREGDVRPFLSKLCEDGIASGQDDVKHVCASMLEKNSCGQPGTEDTGATTEVTPQPTPAPTPPPMTWMLGRSGVSCTTACEENSKACQQSAFPQGNDVTADKVRSLAAECGVTCSSVEFKWANHPIKGPAKTPWGCYASTYTTATCAGEGSHEERFCPCQ